jgi:hypothetical protein
MRFQAGERLLAADLNAALDVRGVSILDFGVAANGVTDDTAAVQRALNAAAVSGFGLRLPAGVIRTTAPLLVTGAVALQGPGCSPMASDLSATGANVRGGGAWLLFDHAGAGLVLGSASGALSGIFLDGFGTLRPEAAPAAGATSYTPTPRDYDIVLNNADLTIGNLVLLNPYQGIRIANVAPYNYSRLTVAGSLRGQPIFRGIGCELVGDTCRIQFHWWPFWTNHPAVRDWTRQNGEAVTFGRADNPVIHNAFAIGYRRNIYLKNWGLGAVSKLRVTDSDFDLGGPLLEIENGRANDTLRLTNVVSEGAPSAIGDTGGAFSNIIVGGTNTKLEIANFEVKNARANNIRVIGTGCQVSLSQARLGGWDVAGSGFPAVEVLTGNRLDITGKPTSTDNPVTYGGAGTIAVDDWRTFVPTVTATTGSITTAAPTMSYRRVADTVDFIAYVPVTDNGTGAGALRLTLPLAAAAAESAVIAGRNTTSNAAVTGIVPSGQAYVDVVRYDGAYPVASGQAIRISGSYRAAS